MLETGDCAVCKSKAGVQRMPLKFGSFYTCPVCGRYELYDLDELEHKAGNLLASYLLYHSFGKNGTIECRYNTPLDKETCDKYNEEFDAGIIHMDVLCIWMRV